MGAQRKKLWMGLIILAIFASGASGWTGEIHGRVICDVCGDSSIGPEDHVLEGLSPRFNFSFLLFCNYMFWERNSRLDAFDFSGRPFLV